MTQGLEALRDLTKDIVRRAHQIDGENLDHLARHLGVPDFATLIEEAHFHSIYTGGGCGTMCATLPALALEVHITDGECGLPLTAERFFLGIGPELDQEEYGLEIEHGQIASRHGTWWNALDRSPHSD